jgi:photosystem II stability/assembly factor-like uncharacterized protein
MRSRLALLAALGAAVVAPQLVAQRAEQPDSRFFSEMRWRLVGPNRAGRVSTVAGVPGDPTTYYIGTPDGGVWKTTDTGVVWKPIFDDVHVPSIGAIAVAQSNPSIVYVGTGHNLIGKGVFRSSDAGRTWQAAGLADTKYITALVVDPKDPNIVLVGVGSGGNFGSMVFYDNNPSPARGVYRTTDGGRTWTHVLDAGPSSGVIDIAADTNDMRVVYASFSGGGGGRGAAAGAGPNVYRSADNGDTWARVASTGFPGDTANIAVASGTSSRRLYALGGGRGGGGAYRSDDGGATWTLGTSRLASASGHLYVDPMNPDVFYTMGTSMYRSTDAGKTLEAIKGAPGGDDNRSFWIDPKNSQRLIIGADQGPTISVDGGQTWTPWYVVQNGEHYYVTADDQFPYWIYAAQQDSGTVAIKSRSDFGAIRPNDWYPVSGYEQGHIFADPLDPRYVYSQGNGHSVIRFDRETGQSGPIYIPKAQDRFGPRPAMCLSPKDPHLFFLGAQYVMETTDRGGTWKTISEDLTGGNGTLVALAPSPVDANILWAGSSNGLIHLTRDAGKTWTNVSPQELFSTPTLTLWSMEASAHDPGVAYASAIDLSDAHTPKLYRTTDFGATWQLIVTGLDPSVPTRVVREDPTQPNLLYAGTQTGAYVSFDRGDHWLSLQLNLPTVAVNDIVVHNDDLVIATWGRALWILDDVTPLRQIDASRRQAANATILFEPAPAVRVRWDVNQDTPLPPEVTSGQNPPDGAIIDYYLPTAAAPPLQLGEGPTLTIVDAGGSVVRQYSSAPPASDASMPNVPMYWFKPADAEQLKMTAGMHRFVWDLRYPTPPSLAYGADGNPATSTSYGIIAPAIIGQSPRQQPLGPLVLPGTYQVRLSGGGRGYQAVHLTVTADPRVKVSTEDLKAQLDWQLAISAGITSAHDAIEALRTLRQQLSERVAGARDNAALITAAQTLDRAALQTITALAGNRGLVSNMSHLENADMKPNDSVVAVLQTSCAAVGNSLARYIQFIRQDLATMNAALTAAHMPMLPAPGPVGPGCGR